MEEKPAQILGFDEINVLGNILNHTFGKSSTRDKGYSITTSMEGNTLTLRYNCVVHFNDTDGLTTQKKEEERQSTQMLDDKIKEVKKEFREIAGRALKVENISDRDDVEMISATSSRKIAYYRRYLVFEIS